VLSMFAPVPICTHIRASQDRTRLYFPTWADPGRNTTSSNLEQIAEMSTTEKVVDLDSIRQRLDRLGVRL
jgi:hypothetical protein